MDSKLLYTFEKNLRYFKQKYPNLYNVVKKIKPRKVKLEKTPYGYDIYLNFSKRFFYGQDINTFIENQFKTSFKIVPDKSIGKIQDTRNSFHLKLLEEIDNIFFSNKHFTPNKFKLDKQIPFLFLLGIGLGKPLEKILEKFEIKNLFIFEPEVEVFILSLYTFPYYKYFEKIYGNIHFCFSSKFDVFEKDVEIFLYKDLLNTQIISIYNHLPQIPLFKAAENYIILQNMKMKRGWGFYDDEKLGLENAKENLNKNIPYLSIQKVKEDIKNYPVFICGSGPSLDEALPLIKKYQDKALIISCGTAIDVLRKNNIKIDFHFELERDETKVKALTFLNEEKYNFPLIGPEVLYPKTFEIFKESYMFPREEFCGYYMYRPKVKPFENSTPSVVNTAVSFFLNVGFKNLYLFGVDLGFVDKEKHHSKDTIYFKGFKPNIEEIFPFKGNFRKQVYTTNFFNWCRFSLENLISKFKDAKVFNTSDGVYIQGTTPLKLENFERFFTSLSLKKEKVISHIKNLFSKDYKETFNPKSKEEVLRDFRVYTNKVLDLLTDINSLKEFQKILENLHKLQENLRKDYEDIYLLMRGTFRHAFYRAGLNFYRLENFDKNVYKRFKNILENYIEKIYKDFEKVILDMNILK